MKLIVKSILLPALILLGACSGQKTSDEDANLSPEELAAVTYVKTHLPEGLTLQDYNIIESEIPVELFPELFTAERNGVFKAGLDYKNAQKRGLTSAEDRFKNELENYQAGIRFKVNALREHNDSSKYMVIYGHALNKRSPSGLPESLIAFYDQKKHTVVKWIPVTVPVKNNVKMILNAENGTLFEYSTDAEANEKNPATDETVTLLKFVLESRAV